MTAAFELRGVTFSYPDGRVALDAVDLSIDAGDVVLLAGPSGSGKSTLLRLTNGLVPHSSGGRLRGTVTAFGRVTTQHRPRDLAAVVGFVNQDPEAQFVVDRVESDLAFSLENLGMDAVSMRRRVEEVMDALGIAHLRDRSPAMLSGGEQQRCAIAGALAAAPSALVLDEPTSQLDPQGADDVLAAIARINADLGTTIVVAEHRLERAAPLAHRAVLLEDGRVASDGSPGDVLAAYAGAPAVTHLGRLLGWTPLPLTVRDARRLAAARPPHRESADGGTGFAGLLHSGPASDPAGVESAEVEGSAATWTAAAVTPSEGDPERRLGPTGRPLIETRALTVELGGRTVLGPVDLTVHEGEVVALLGRNGAGKTTLLRGLAGLVDPSTGTVTRGETAAAYVPQDPNALLFQETVRAEVGHTLRLLGQPDRGQVDRWLSALRIADLAERHPRSLSAGERQRVAIAAVAVGGAPVLLLDEPTRGMDAPSRDALAHAVGAHAESGGAVVLATHDVELAARVATRVVVVAGGDVVADGPTAHVLSGSLFAPQVLRVLPPFLTVDQVARALGVQR